MRSIQTQHTFPLSSVKPLDSLRAYRAYCLEATRQALQGGSPRERRHSPVSGAPLEEVGLMGDLPYVRSPEGGSLFLGRLPDARTWAGLLADVARYRHSPNAFHTELTRSRTDNVYAPKLEWIWETLRLQGVERPHLLEVVTPPSDLSLLLRESGLCASVTTVDEMGLAHAGTVGRSPEDDSQVEAAVLFESLDRVDEPRALLKAVAERLAPEGLIFVTALVSSGFDFSILGARNLYLYPPDRTNCFSLQDLTSLLTTSGFSLLEISTPGVLDVEIVRAHLAHDPAVPLSAFERQLMAADHDTHAAFQLFLQQRGLSSFARIVGRRLG